jgi:hypothetical protein
LSHGARIRTWPNNKTRLKPPESNFSCPTKFQLTLHLNKKARDRSNAEVK